MEILKQYLKRENNMKLKVAILCAGIACLSQNTQAQIQYIPAGVHPFSISLGGGVTTTFGDLNKKVFRPAARGNFDYNITPHIATGIELQYGGLASGAPDAGEGLYSKSSFWAANANIRLALGQFMPANERGFKQFLGGIYLGTGVGIVSSEVKEIVAYYPADGTPIKGKIIDEAMELAVPVNIGLNIELPAYRLGANINYQHNTTLL
jgi:hypothetical protein